MNTPARDAEYFTLVCLRFTHKPIWSKQFMYLLRVKAGIGRQPARPAFSYLAKAKMIEAGVRRLCALHGHRYLDPGNSHAVYL
jgi:hypothetical protein